MDVIWIAAAFALGFLAKSLRLPPLVGYLVTGFILFALGIEGGTTLQKFADIGVTLLLFSIGLKLKLGNLLMPQVWGVASLHMLAVVLVLSLGLYALMSLGVAGLAPLELKLAALIAFALSFSSTVFAVKVLEEKSEMATLYGRISIGILIIQDIAAVIFLAASLGKVPSLWALLLLTLLPLRPLLYRILTHSGHGELLILFGLTVALGGAFIFELAGVKGDLGALLLGLLFSKHSKSSELANHLLGFKDLFLVGFFLTIGLSGIPSINEIAIAVLLVLLIPAKAWLFFWLLVRFQLRSRTAFLASLSLANYSEFGLIVGAIAVNAGWIGPQWLVIIAVALAISFVLAAPFNSQAHALYSRFHDRLVARELPQRILEEQAIDPRDATVLVFGMGRIGTGTYDTLRDKLGDTILGLDMVDDTVKRHQQQGRNVIRADAADPDFLERFHLDQDKIQLVMLAMPNHRENMLVTRQLRRRGYHGKIAAIAKYPDEVASLTAAGADVALNLYAEAGIGFADDVMARLMTEHSTPSAS